MSTAFSVFHCRLNNWRTYDVKFVAIFLSLWRTTMKLKEVHETKKATTYLTVVYCLRDSYLATGIWKDYCSKTPSHNGTCPPLYNNPGIPYCTSMIAHRTDLGQQEILQLKDKYAFQMMIKRAEHSKRVIRKAPTSLPCQGEALFRLPRAISFFVTPARGRSWKRGLRATIHL